MKMSLICLNKTKLIVNQTQSATQILDRVKTLILYIIPFNNNSNNYKRDLKDDTTM